TVTFNAPGSGGFAFGADAAATTTVVNLNGGTLNMNGNAVNDPGTAIAPFTAFAFNGGTLRNATGIFATGGVIQNGGILLRDQAGTTTIGNAATAGTNVYTVAGGAAVQLNAPAASLVALSAGSLARTTA